MKSTKREETPAHDDLWIITNGRYADLDLSGIYEGVQPEFVKEYRISDLAKYMLNPNPIEVEKKLIGCEVYSRKPCFAEIKEKIRRILPQKLQKLIKEKDIPHEVLVSDCETNTAPLKDRNLESHFNKIYESLRPYDPILEKLSKLNPKKILDIIALCEDIDGIRSVLNLQGSIDEKINYMVNFIMKDVRVILEKAHIANGLFEMRGFDFRAYDPENAYRLIKFLHNGKTKACVLNPDNKIEYWIDDINHVHYMHLLDQAIKTNPRFNDSLNKCTKGDAKAFKILFNKQLKIDYSRAHLPRTYKEFFEACEVGSNEKDIVMNSLKNLQLSISFNYIAQYDSGKEKIYTNISVMHDFRAIEPIKSDLPQLYSEINKRASISEAGKFYLLDSVRGYINE